MPRAIGIGIGVNFGGALPGFSPSNLNPALWLDASDTSTITASSGSVSQWNNKGSLGNFVQATGAVQPTTGASTVNGRNVIDFAGDYLTASNTNEWKFLHDGTIWIFGAVWQIGTSSNPNAIYNIWGSSGSTNSANGYVFGYDDRTSASRNDTVYIEIARNNPGNLTVSIPASGTQNAHPAGVPVVVSHRADPSNATAADRLVLQINSNATIATNTSTQPFSTNNPTNPLQIGSSGTGTGALTGKIAEMVVVSGANATDANRLLIRDYLAAKWGVTL